MPRYSQAGHASNRAYKIAASQSAVDISATGAAGDYIAGILVTPSATTLGVVTLIDGAVSYPLVIGGTYTMQPFYIPLGMTSQSGKWTITTGVGLSVVVLGQLT